jgi:hypothetical protein
MIVLLRDVDHMIVLLCDVGQVEAYFSPLGDVTLDAR